MSRLSSLISATKNLEEEQLKFILGIFFALSSFAIIFFSAPSKFPLQKVITIEEGWGLSQTGEYLHQEKVIRHASLFKFFGFISGNQNNIVAGDYLLYNDKNVLRIIEDVVTGDYGISLVSITVPEGNTIVETAKILKEKFPSFSESSFIFLARGKEGYLFPDTYKFLPNVKPEKVIEAMTKNFEDRTKGLENELQKSGRTLEGIVTMASIIEEEARNKEDRRIISGVLWKRIDLGIALQVDATFLYINGKNTYELTTEDLKEDHPYNTYTNRGLPPGPITNPGLDAILAALRPKESPYLFYLSDRTGKTYYAEDFEEHKKNKRLYLNLE